MLEDGAAERDRNHTRRTASWMALHLAATTGQPVKPWELLGEEPWPNTENEAASSKAELIAMQQRYEALMRDQQGAVKSEVETECPAS